MPLEIERKFLVKSNLQVALTNGSPVCQGYIDTTERTTVRARIKGASGFITIKGPSDSAGLVRSEFEYEIPQEDARIIIDTLCGDRVLEKDRYVLQSGKHNWEIDIFHGNNEGLVMAEVELESVDEIVKLPEWVETEVTGDPRYYNRSLVEKPWPEWS